MGNERPRIMARPLLLACGLLVSLFLAGGAAAQPTYTTFSGIAYSPFSPSPSFCLPFAVSSLSSLRSAAVW